LSCSRLRFIKSSFYLSATGGPGLKVQDFTCWRFADGIRAELISNCASALCENVFGPTADSGRRMILRRCSISDCTFSCPNFGHWSRSWTARLQVETHDAIIATPDHSQAASFSLAASAFDLPDFPCLLSVPTFSEMSGWQFSNPFPSGALTLATATQENRLGRLGSFSGRRKGSPEPSNSNGSRPAPSRLLAGHS